jgi:hypothetical protein
MKPPILMAGIRAFGTLVLLTVLTVDTLLVFGVAALVRRTSRQTGLFA